MRKTDSTYVCLTTRIAHHPAELERTVSQMFGLEHKIVAVISDVQIRIGSDGKKETYCLRQVLEDGLDIDFDSIILPTPGTCLYIARVTP
jgi:hypothetical protein